jgi:lysophospholipase L1-like esterase
MHRLACAALLAAALALPTPAAASGLVALGDSFSSGEGVRPYEPGTEHACHRSARAWPLLLAAALRAPASSLACSGATTTDLELTQLGRVDRAAALVTLTIGGNDLGFGEVIRRCVFSDCRRHFTRGGRDRIDARIARLRGRLPDIYRRVTAAAPNARLLVMGYPRLFPRRPRRFTCAALGTITRDEALYLNAKVASADRTIRAAARAAGAAYADALGAFAGGEVRCGGHGYVGRLDFHPTAAGHARLAEVALAALGREVRDR